MNEHHNQLKSELLAELDQAQPPHGMTTKIIAIDGGGAAGKTTFAKTLSGWLSGAPIIITDDFASWGNPLDWWPRLLEQVLEPLSKNQAAYYQRYDWKEIKLAEWHDVAPGSTIILEGVSSMRKEFRPYLAYRIWIEAPKDLRLQRGLERDRGIAGEDNREQWVGWQKAETKHFAEHKNQAEADLIIEAATQPYRYHFTAIRGRA